MKLYKILIKIEDKYYSPFQMYCYGTLSDLLNKKLTCDNFDVKSIECSDGFYATPIQGLIYTQLLDNPNKVVFEMEMSGRNVKFSDYKWRWEHQTFKRELSMDEVKELVKEESLKMDWNYYDMLFPQNPLETLKSVTLEHKRLLKKWMLVRDSVEDSVRYSVWNSVEDSVWRSVWDSVWRSVRGSVGDSVRGSVGDSIAAYISAGFPNIKKWKYIDHEEGINPFQSGIDLWKSGFVLSFDGNIWRLHSGPKATIVFEITKEDLEKL
jgi:hypothetical protein